MEPSHPALSANDPAPEWRLARLARLDGRVREILRVLTREPVAGVSSSGEAAWARHVRSLHDTRGTLLIGITEALADSPWLPVVAAAVGRAWESEDEAAVAFRVEGRSRPVALSEILPPGVPEDTVPASAEGD